MQRRRRVVGIALIAIAIVLFMFKQQSLTAPTYVPQTKPAPTTADDAADASIEEATAVATVHPSLARDILHRLEVKGRAPKTGYERTQFGDGWLLVGSCDMRNIILNRDLMDASVNDTCKVTSGVLADPYTGTTVTFTRGKDTSDIVQIDHVVALSNAWQTGAQQLSVEQRIAFANDPLELLAVDGNANQAKGDGDAATWLPANKTFRCQYVARQIAVKYKYSLWVTGLEKEAMLRVLESCPEQSMPSSQ